MSHAAASSFGFASAVAARRAGVASWLRGVRRLARIHRTLRVETGTSIVEFALASIILFTLIFGLLAICLALYSYNVVSEAAREATRYAIVRGSVCNTLSNCNIDQPGLQTYIRGIAFPGINPLSLTVAASATTPAGTTCTGTLTPCNIPGNPVQVTVTYTFPLGIPFMPSRTLTMSSTSQMIISQ
jgi:Flp pilus assembly protein TadG